MTAKDRWLVLALGLIALAFLASNASARAARAPHLLIETNQETLTLLPSDDAYVQQDPPNDTIPKGATNSNQLRVRSWDGHPDHDDDWYMQTLVKFDLSGLAPGTVIVSATLNLYYENWSMNDPVGRTHTCYEILADWDENTVTWVNRPGYKTAATDDALVPDAPGWVSWDVTGDVTAHVAGGGGAHYGWLISDDGTWNDYDIPDAHYMSKEGVVTKSGYPAWFYTFAPGTIEIIPGGSYSESIRGANLGMWSAECSQAVDGLDTFCVALYDDLGWQIVANNINVCYVNPSGYFGPWINITITAPCEATVGQTNVLTALMRYCDVNLACRPEAGGCPVEDLHPQYPSVTTKTFEVVEAPPALYILQDTLYFVGQGQTAAFVPFAICNGDPCADDTEYGYLITSLGHVGPAISQGGVITVAGGECEDVYGIIDAGEANVCDYDTLTIIAWAGEEPEVVYDTCVQMIHVIGINAVPMFTTPVVTILVLAMILAAAVIMKRRAAGRV